MSGGVPATNDAVNLAYRSFHPISSSVMETSGFSLAYSVSIESKVAPSEPVRPSQRSIFVEPLPMTAGGIAVAGIGVGVVVGFWAMTLTVVDAVMSTSATASARGNITNTERFNTVYL